MARWYTRAEQRAYRDERRAQAALVANRLMGKKKSSLFSPDDNVAKFFGGTQMYMPIQYRMSQNLNTSNPRTSFVISGMEGV